MPRSVCLNTVIAILTTGVMLLQLSTPARAAGYFAYVVHQDGTIAQYSISSAGVFQPVAAPAVTLGASSTRLVADPSGAFAYVADSSWKLHVFKTGKDGSLSQVDEFDLASKKMPSDIVIAPSGKYLYLSFNALEVDGNSEIYSYAIGPDGKLAPLKLPSVKSGSATNSLAIHPSGRYLYAANRWDGTISQFQINADGSLSPLDPPLMRWCGMIGNIAFSSAGTFLYSTDDKSQCLSQFRVAEDGQLSKIAVGVYANEADALGDGAIVYPDPLYDFVTVAYTTGRTIYRFKVEDGKLASRPQYQYKITRDGRLLTRDQLSALVSASSEVKAIAKKDLNEIKGLNARARASARLTTYPATMAVASDGSMYLVITGGILNLSSNQRTGALQITGIAAKWKDKLDVIDEARAAGKDDYETSSFPIRRGITLVQR